jgi:glutaminyl-peptide cyclotransferase
MRLAERAGTGSVKRDRRPGRGAFAAAVVAAAAWIAGGASAQGLAPLTVPVYEAEVIHIYPHDTRAFTEGLFYLNGYLYESTGLEGESTIRKVRLKTGEVVQRIDIPPAYFGEGIIDWQGRLISLTWKSHVGFIFDLRDFKRTGRFEYPGEGWALTRNDREIFMSDGTPDLRVLDPSTLEEIRRIHVTLDGKPLPNVNELEWVKGEIYANVWQTDWIVRIDPVSGKVVAAIHLPGLLKPRDIVQGQTDVLNGIAYDAKNDRLFVTGKNWPKLFEIRLTGPSMPMAR